MNLKSVQRDSGAYEIQDENGLCFADVWSARLMHGLPQETTDILAAMFVASPIMFVALKRIAFEFDPTGQIDAAQFFNECRGIAREAIGKAELSLSVYTHTELECKGCMGPCGQCEQPGPETFTEIFGSQIEHTPS